MFECRLNPGDKVYLTGVQKSVKKVIDGRIGQWFGLPEWDENKSYVG